MSVKCQTRDFRTGKFCKQSIIRYREGSPGLEGCRREEATLVGEVNLDALPRQDTRRLPRKKAVCTAGSAQRK